MNVKQIKLFYITFFFLFGSAESGIRGSQDEERLVMLSERNKIMKKLGHSIFGKSFHN